MTNKSISHGWQGKQVTGFSQSRKDKKPKTPNISYQNLFFYYDFGNGNSYSGSGTTVNDLSGNGFTATLINTPTYSNVYDGVETFNSTNTSATSVVTGASRSAMTFIAFIKRNGNTASYSTPIILRGIPAGSIYDIGLAFKGTTNQINYVWGTSALNYDFVSGLTPPLNQWCMIAAAIDLTGGTIYLNNLSINNTKTNTSTTNGTQMSFGNDSGLAQGVNSDIGIVMCYTRKLSQSEIMQIFEAYRPRYGI